MQNTARDSVVLLISLSYHLSLSSLFCLFLSGLLRQALLYLSDHSEYTGSEIHCKFFMGICNRLTTFNFDH